MITRLSMGWIAFCLVAASAVGQPAELSLVVPNGVTTIEAGQRVTIEVLANNIVSPTLLKAYQIQIEAVPLAGATGSLQLAGPVQDDSIFVDEGRADWVFAAETAFFTTKNVALLRTAATLFFGGDEVLSPSYCSTYIFEAPLAALGDFQIRFVPIDPTTGATATFMLNQSNLPIPFNSLPAGGVTITVLPPTAVPPNDNCANAFAIFDGVTLFRTTDGTTDGVDLPLSCDEGSGVSIEQDVWFEHVASCTGLLTVSTCDDADFDTRLAIYGSETPTCTCPTDNTSFLACNDNTVGCALGTSELSLSVTEGNCYTIRLGGVATAQGTGNVTITCAPDLCADAEPIAINGSATNSTANTVVNDAIGPDCGLGPVDSPGVWYTVTGTGNRMTASLCGGATFDSRLTIYEGTCGALACVADADDTCGIQESASWCSTAGTPYLILVHGSGGAAGSFTLQVSDQSCNDGNACTTDGCTNGACTSTNNFDDTIFCCAPVSGNLTTIDDGDACSNDVCNPSTGNVSHTPLPDGPIAGCDDGNLCTFDSCLNGTCTSSDINTIPCTSDPDCPGTNTCAPDGFCDCFAATLELVGVPGTLPASPDCYAAGGLVFVRVELGPPGTVEIVPPGREIIGSQFFLHYDSSTLSFVSVQPGAVLGEGSPFSSEISEQVDPVAGTIDYLVGVSFGSGTRTPATVALVTFQALFECNATVGFRSGGPNGEPNIMVITGGEDLLPALVDLPPIVIDAVAPVITGCPADLVTPPDAGRFTATVSWPAPTATDSCDAGAIPVVCDPPSGSAFPIGNTTVTCTSTDSCGLQDVCTFNVTVQRPQLTVDVELSPTMAPGPLQRCITFDLWDCNGPIDAQHATVSETLTFVNGLASGVVLTIPAGAWECISARDELHSLSATAANFTTVDGLNYTASFTGSRAAGGHWLMGGNLNDDDFIDIRDFGVFFPFFLTVAGPDTPCGTAPPHANINGDPVVDLLDLVFISGNSLQASEPKCCVVGRAASTDGPVMSITVRELRRTGQFDLIAADVNRDGVLDMNDLTAVMEGNIPPAPNVGSVREARPLKRPAGRPSRRAPR